MNKVLFSHKSDLWSTPQDFFDLLDREFHFDLDPCALPENAKCKRFITPSLDGLKVDWDCNCAFVNPPYSDCYNWVKRCFENQLNSKCRSVMLLPVRTDTKWFHEFIYNNLWCEIRFLKGRLKFGNSKNSAPFPSMVVIFNLPFLI